VNTLKRISTIVMIGMLILSACGPSATETQIPIPKVTVAPTSTPRPEKNVALNKPVRVSASWVVDPPERAVDGNLNNWWGAGGPVPAWIEVDLQGLYSVSRIKVINQGPTGNATYDVYGRGSGYQTQLLHSFPGNKTENQVLEFSPQPAWEDIATIRIEINSGTGWAGLREIQVFSRDEPKPLPESGKEKTPSFLAEVHSDELAPITPDNAIFVHQLAMFGRGPVNEITWSPDGKTLAVASPLGVWLYDPNDLKADPLLLEGHTRDVLSASFSPDGKTLLSGSQDGTVKQWDAVSGELIQTKPLWADFSYEVGNAPREKEVWSIAFSPDGEWMASGSYDGRLQLWNPTLGSMRGELKGHTNMIDHMVFNPDSTLLASSSVDNTVFIWDMAAKKQVANLPVTGQVSSLVFSPDGKTMAYGGHGMSVRLWDIATQKETEIPEFTDTLSLAFSPDNLTLAASAMDGSVRLWNLAAGKSDVFKENAGWITDLSFSPDGSSLLVHSWNGILQLWDLETGEDMGMLVAHTQPVNAIAFDPDAEYIASGGEDGLIWVRDVETGDLKKVMIGHARSVTGLAYSPDGNILASSSFDGTVRLWDAETAKPIAILQGHTSYVRCVAFSPDGKLVASGSTDKTVRLWDLATGKEKFVLTGHTGEIQSVAFSPDGLWLVSASADKTLRVWEVATGKEFKVIEGHLSFVLGAEFSPNGNMLASVGGDHGLHGWNWSVVSGTAISNNHFPPIGHPGWVVSVTFTPDGRLIASANVSSTGYWVAPGEIHLYGSDTGYPYALLRGHTKRVTDVAVSADGKLLASGSADGSIRIWGVSRDDSPPEVFQASQETPTVSTPTPMPANWDPFVGEWTATDPGDGSNMTLTISQSSDGGYSITLLDDGSRGCGLDNAGKPKFGIKVVFAAKAIGDMLSASSTSVTCLSNPSSPLDTKINQNFIYQPETDTLWDDANRTDWKRNVSSSPSSSSWRDDFDGSLTDGWYWVKEDSSKWNLTETPGSLRIYISPYEKDGKIQNRLLRRITAKNFKIMTHVIFEPKTNFQFAGLTIYQDENNTLSFGRAFCDTPNVCVGNGIYFDYVSGGTWTGSNFGTSVGSPNDAYLRLERHDDVIRAFFSFDGLIWTEIGSHTIPSDFLVSGVGLIASGDYDKSDADIPADFDFFELTEIQ
jgi:WD40 repeat protein/regulation of enolase protein 1 (concanavalin A-like superfamily)